MAKKEPKQESKKRKLVTDEYSPDFNALDINIPTYPYKSSSEYAAAVNQWLWQCYNWQYLTVTLPCLMSQAASRMQILNSDGTTDFNRNFPNTFFPNQNYSAIQPQRVNGVFQSSVSVFQQSQGRIYIIPGLGRRIIAEIIDFMILLVLKVMITYVAVECFDLINLDKYDFTMIHGEKLDIQAALEVTSEILALEVIHRFVVCVFEAMFTHKGVSGPGGATPGKTLMRLRIISCESIIPIEGNLVRVYPAGDLGLGWAMVRAFIKNFSYAFIFPMCCTMYFFQFNRTAYDHMCGSLVVEEFPRRITRN